jgi:hypothetical protein
VKGTLPDLPDLLVQIFCFFLIPSSRLFFFPAPPRPASAGEGKVREAEFTSAAAQTIPGEFSEAPLDGFGIL